MQNLNLWKYNFLLRVLKGFDLSFDDDIQENRKGEYEKVKKELKEAAG